MSGSEQERFEVQVTIGAPVEAVWRALREPEEIRRWHGWHCDSLDEEIDLIYGKGVTASEPERWLEMKLGDRFELTDLGGGSTRLRMIRGPRGENPDWDAYYDDINEGWTTFLHQLKFALERHPGAPRRTVFLAGGGRPVFDVAGLAGPAATPVGDRYAAQVPAGERLDGQVWFRSANQIGLTVDAWGDGLLVVGEQPASAMRPDGGGMAVLTCYGLDDEAFETVRTRWRTWWESVYGDKATVT